MHAAGTRRLAVVVAATLALTACTSGDGAPESKRSPDRQSSPADPRPQPARAPLTTLTVVGDIMLGRGVADQPGGAAARLRPMAGQLRSADLTVGNLESTLSDDGAPQ